MSLCLLCAEPFDGAQEGPVEGGVEKTEIIKLMTMFKKTVG